MTVLGPTAFAHDCAAAATVVYDCLVVLQEICMNVELLILLSMTCEHRYHDELLCSTSFLLYCQASDGDEVRMAPMIFGTFLSGNLA